ncbi:MAG: response regulator transcription factor [Planctomycetaceae bacterium]
MSVPASEHLTVHVIDDDAIVRRAFELGLASRNVKVVTSANAEEFLSRVQVEPRGCLVIDYKLGATSGVELLKTIRQRDWTLPAVLLSSEVDVPGAMEAVQYGVIDVVQKPISLSEMLAMVDSALEAVSRVPKHSPAFLRDRLAKLSSREQQIMWMLLDGVPNKTIAAQLDIGLRTVVRHRSEILDSFQVQSIPELATAIGEAGIVVPRFQSAERTHTHQRGHWQSTVLESVDEALQQLRSLQSKPEIEALGNSPLSEAFSALETLLTKLDITGRDERRPLIAPLALVSLTSCQEEQFLIDILQFFSVVAVPFNPSQQFESPSSLTEMPPEFLVIEPSADFDLTQLLRQVRSLWTNANVFLVDREGQCTAAHAGRWSGKVHCLSLPFSGIELGNRMREILASGNADAAGHE